MRRPKATVLAVVALFALGALTLAPATPALACGCGAVVGPATGSTTPTASPAPSTAPPGSTKTGSTGEKAIVSFNGNTETMDVSFAITSGAGGAGLLVPTPSDAVLTSGDGRLFDLIDATIRPAVVEKTDWWGLGYVLPHPPTTAPTVVKRVTLGALEAVTLQATDTGGLALWLSSHGFVVSKGMTASLQSYITLGWSFTAITLNPANESTSRALTGTIDPIRLTFRTPRMVYPMRFASLDAAPYSLRLYVFDQQRAHLAQANTPTLDIKADVTVAWAGAVTDSRLVALGPYLTAFDVRVEHPADDISSDIGIVADTSRTDVKPTVTHYRMVTLLGVPVGTLLVVWALLGIALLTGHFVGRYRAR